MVFPFYAIILYPSNLKNGKFTATLLRAIAKQTQSLDALESRVNVGDVEAVHDLRVALRRLRSALRLLDDPDADNLRKRAKAVADTVGAVRDLDVLLEMPKIPNAWKFALRLERERALSIARSQLADKGHLRWKGRLAEWLAQDFEAESEGNVFEDALQIHVDEVIALRSAASDEEFHQLRINVKRLRYLLEFFQKGMLTKAKKCIKGLTEIQDELGRYHDAVVARQRLNLAIEAATGLSLKSKLIAFQKTLAEDKQSQLPSESATRATGLAQESLAVQLDD
ncbi:MAG: CHAD domain-containing protein [Chlorobia bacterium]|nr:CHAD domain-containing protein [Fimbriimonadaceae bacterium]